MADRRAPTLEEQALGQRLRELRRRSGRKVWEIAHDLGMGEQNYLGYETGRNQIKVLNVPDFARALRMNPHDLFEQLFPVQEEMEAFKRGWAALKNVVDSPAAGASCLVS